MTKRGITDAVEQIEATIDEVVGGSIPHMCARRPEKAGSLIVVANDLPMSLIAESVLLPALPATEHRGGILRLMPQVIGLNEMETMDGWPKRTLIDVLDKKMRNRSTGVESLRGYRFFQGDEFSESQILKELIKRLSDTMLDWNDELRKFRESLR